MRFNSAAALKTVTSDESTGNPEWDSELAALEGRLRVERPQEWEQAIGFSPRAFYELWSRGLPGQVRLDVALTGGGQGEINLDCRDGNRTFLWAERSFDRPRGTMQIKEVRVESENFRRCGLGKTLLANQIDVAAPWGIRTFRLTAGREDGPYFWSRRGAMLDHFPNVDASRQPAARFAGDIERGLCHLKDMLSADFERAVRQSLAADARAANCVIARLPGDLPDGAGSMAWVLMGYVCEFRAVIDLEDPVQMATVRAGLGGSVPAPAFPKPAICGTIV